ncbi:hypothetical protein BDF20DRAFT_926749 [Mycotypha africana]|uniref:uncharacterized protein n=1 Tax=Mycotypha africana TaxID=64632 RepID=UPI0023003CE5|nr:uncharacterized protein BDF20DRAFT_926749 [Mycotypha africana]KAI8967946.1 hypothetical protein BDF20DRAFT_926749 [Mycotypha africana]
MPDTTVDQPVEYPLEDVDEKVITESEETIDLAEEEVSNNYSRNEPAITVEENVLITSMTLIHVEDAINVDNTINEDSVLANNNSEAIETNIASVRAVEKAASPVSEDDIPQRLHRRSASGDVSLLSKSSRDDEKKAADINVKFSPVTEEENKIVNANLDEVVLSIIDNNEEIQSSREIYNERNVTHSPYTTSKEAELNLDTNDDDSNSYNPIIDNVEIVNHDHFAHIEKSLMFSSPDVNNEDETDINPNLTDHNGDIIDLDSAKINEENNVLNPAIEIGEKTKPNTVICIKGDERFTPVNIIKECVEPVAISNGRKKAELNPTIDILRKDAAGLHINIEEKAKLSPTLTTEGKAIHICAIDTEGPPTLNLVVDKEVDLNPVTFSRKKANLSTVTDIDEIVDDIQLPVADSQEKINFKLINGETKEAKPDLPHSSEEKYNLGVVEDNENCVKLQPATENVEKTPIPSPVNVKKGLRLINRDISISSIFSLCRQTRSARYIEKESQKEKSKKRKYGSKRYLSVVTAVIMKYFAATRRDSIILVSSSSSAKSSLNSDTVSEALLKRLQEEDDKRNHISIRWKLYLAQQRRTRSDTALWNKKDPMWDTMREYWQESRFSDIFNRNKLAHRSVPGLETDDDLGRIQVPYEYPWRERTPQPRERWWDDGKFHDFPYDQFSPARSLCSEDNLRAKYTYGRFDQPLRSYAGSTVSVKEVTKEDRKLMYLENAINELYQTEDAYNRQLEGLSEHYFRLMESAGIVTDEIRSVLMRNGRELYQFHEAFKEELEAARTTDGIGYCCSYKNLLNIAKCLKKWAPKFDIYVDFCTGHEAALKLVEHLEKTNDRFFTTMSQIRRFQWVIYNNIKVTFEDYLHFPFQRICRYNLLITAIAKGIEDKTSEEYRTLEEAKALYHQVLVQINERKAQMQAVKKTKLFISRIEPDWRLPFFWAEMLGPCILIGTLEVRYNQERWAKRRGCGLFKQYCIMVKAKDDDRYEGTHWFPLQKCEIEDHSEHKVSWVLRYNDHRFEMSALSALEKNLWITTLKNAIAESKQLCQEDPAERLLGNIFISNLDPQPSDPRELKYNEGLFAFGAEQPSNRQSMASTVTFATAVSCSNLPSKRNSKTSISDVNLHELGRSEAKNVNTRKLPSRNSRPHSMEDLQFFFSNASERLPKRPVTISNNRQKAFEAKFSDVCYTPVLKARIDFSAFSPGNSRRMSIIKNPADLFKRPVSEILLSYNNVRDSYLRHSRSLNLGEGSSSSKTENQCNDIDDRTSLKSQNDGNDSKTTFFEVRPTVSHRRADLVFKNIALRANTLFRKKAFKDKKKHK